MNIPWNIPWNISWNMEILKMEYSKINFHQGNTEIFGIRNIQKKSKREIFKYLEYGKLQEYSKNRFSIKIGFFVGNINYVIFQKKLGA